MLRLLIATTNQGKVTEFTRLLGDLPLEIIGLDSLSPSLPAPAETGQTFAENALLKASYYFAATGLLALADDSGLEVDALNGAPGIHSARYAGAGAGDPDRIARLLDELRLVPDPERTARFKCSIALAGIINDREERRVFEGSCEGLIARAPRGSHGFGYDPVFLDRELNRTFAELTPQEKAARSHRGRALIAVRNFLISLDDLPDSCPRLLLS
jgi:XTP/dITP diphosphohydrolase